ncbi:hypothetical protein KR084_003088, partial [Drosophila pseudotakahashii]
EGALHDFLLSKLECPVCFGHILPPIQQCINGHIICSDCRSKLSKCPVCRRSRIDIRCPSLDKMASKLIFPCQHSEYGCLARVACEDKGRHENYCEFRPYYCPFARECVWEGELKDVYLHQSQAHGDVIPKEGNEATFVVVNVLGEYAPTRVMVQSCHGRLFVWVVTTRNYSNGRWLYSVACRIIGEATDAAQFVYNFSFMANGQLVERKTKVSTIRDRTGEIPTYDVMFITEPNDAYTSADGDIILNVAVNRGDMVPL